MLRNPPVHTRARAVALALAGLVGCLLAACASDGGRPMQGGLASDVERLKAYKLGVGDKVRVTVFGETDLSGTFEVDPLGNLAMPLIGEMPAKGKQPAELRQALVERLSGGYLKNPRISVEIAGYRPFYVHGEVRNGGEFAFKPGLTMRDAVALAGGYTYRAQEAHVLLTRDGETTPARMPVGSGALVLPGDNIRVPERFF